MNALDSSDGCGAIVFDWGDTCDDSSIIELTGSYLSIDYSWFVQTTIKSGSDGYYSFRGSDDNNTSAEDVIATGQVRAVGYFGDWNYTDNNGIGQKKGHRRTGNEYSVTFGGTVSGADGDSYHDESGGIGDGNNDDIVMAVGFRDGENWTEFAFISEVTSGLNIPSETIYGNYALYGKTGEFGDLGIIPEPATMLILGLGGLFLRRRKR